MNARQLLFPPGATPRDWVTDGFLAVSLALVSTMPFALSSQYSPYLPLLAMLSATMTLPLAIRRHSPLLTMVLVTLAGLLHLFWWPLPTFSLSAIPIVAYTVARWVPGPLARSVIVVGAFASALGPMRWSVSYSGNPSTDILAWGACLGAVLTPYAIGRRSRDIAEARASHVRTAEEHYQLLLAEREQLAKLGEAAARTMIARELHDIVAHSLSVMIVQAEGGRAAAIRKPEAAAQALDTIAETGREALHEMRRIVGVLRAGPDAKEPTNFAPMPTLADIPELVARTSDRARLVVQGHPYPASQALALTAFRVTQEALTNFLKHAGPHANATVTLTHGPSSLTIDVVDDGDGVDGVDGVVEQSDGGGNGLRGMYERVTSMGGTLRAGPLEDRTGFRVRAELPVPHTRPHEGA